MKKLLINISFLVAAAFVISCDSNFDELNTNKVSATSIDPAFQLNAAIVGCAYPNGSLIYDIGVVQQIISLNSGVFTGANYIKDNRNATQA